MNRRRLLAIGGLAAVLGVAASWYVYRSLDAKYGALQSEGTTVVIAARDISAGERITDRDVNTVHYPRQFLPVSVLHKSDAAVGLVALLPIAKGEFVLSSKVDIGGDWLTARVPVGMRAVPLPVSELESNLIKPGDRVDVLVTGIAPGTNDTQTRTVLANARFLAIGSRAVALFVSPEDAEKLTLALQEGRVKLVFRNPADTTQENPPAITRTTLYGAVQPAKTRMKLIHKTTPEKPDVEVEIIHGSERETRTLKQ